jgi:hypothetical protein
MSLFMLEPRRCLPRRSLAKTDVAVLRKVQNASTPAVAKAMAWPAARRLQLVGKNFRQAIPLIGLRPATSPNTYLRETTELTGFTARCSHEFNPHLTLSFLEGEARYAFLDRITNVVDILER